MAEGMFSLPLLDRTLILMSYPYLQLKQEFEMIKLMRNQSGWGWDSEKNAPIVSDDVWNAFIKVRIECTVLFINDSYSM